ncbi:hypothetical protein [Mycobacterium sp. 1274756.6]|nr:hypothetical protein [Mycobacterium sp. 1274756.6]
MASAKALDARRPKLGCLSKKLDVPGFDPLGSVSRGEVIAF